MMDDCDRFEQIQLEALLDRVSPSLRRWADEHLKICEDCRRSATRDRWLDAAFAHDIKVAEKGFKGAHQMLMNTIRERRAFCCQVEGPFGPVYLARTEQGLCRVSFKRTEEDFMDELERKELLPERAAGKCSKEVRQLESYFKGKRTDFRVPIDLRFVTPFQRKVLEATSDIPFGEVASYSDIAHKIGQPGARRAVGGALGRNPVAIVIPCHRVVAAGGKIGGYTGGLDIKRELMRIEGISLEKEES